MLVKQRKFKKQFTNKIVIMPKRMPLFFKPQKKVKNKMNYFRNKLAH